MSIFGLDLFLLEECPFYPIEFVNECSLIGLTFNKITLNSKIFTI